MAIQTLINPQVQQRCDALREQFRSAFPFRHLVIDDFLSQAFAEALLAQFPPFERGNHLSENGTPGDKSTVERVRELGPAYTQLDDLIQTREFLDFVGRLTGIDQLLYDPWYFGGGTHENRHGQDLDAHIDFNRHPIEPWHRRLNLIVYLNHRWDDAWGGSLQLHSDPHSEQNQVLTITPLFNRAVIFETTEWSWHGFPPIRLPESVRHLSRKSVALYFYTTDRPADELADTHSTIYVDRPLPPRYVEGYTLGADDVEEVKVLLRRRDMHIQRLYRDITTLTKQLENARAALRAGAIGKMEHAGRRLLSRLFLR